MQLFKTSKNIQIRHKMDVTFFSTFRIGMKKCIKAKAHFSTIDFLDVSTSHLLHKKQSQSGFWDWNKPNIEYYKNLLDQITSSLCNTRELIFQS